jgi:hypothetical protein
LLFIEKKGREGGRERREEKREGKKKANKWSTIAHFLH